MKALVDDKYWVYKGKPEEIREIVPDTLPHQGGYVLLYVFKPDSYKVTSTRFPGRSASALKTKMKQLASNVEIDYVMISKPKLGYEKICRSLNLKLKEIQESSKKINEDQIVDAANEEIRRDDKMIEEKKKFTKKYSHLYSNQDVI